VLHAQAPLHSIPPAQVCFALQTTSHGPAPQVTVPKHEPLRVQAISQLFASEQSTPLAQELTPLHWTEHAIPAGQVTTPGQALPLLQAIWQMPWLQLSQAEGQAPASMPPPPSVRDPDASMVAPPSPP
jgi:hypothetical protein